MEEEDECEQEVIQKFIQVTKDKQVKKYIEAIFNHPFESLLDTWIHLSDCLDSNCSVFHCFLFKTLLKDYLHFGISAPESINFQYLFLIIEYLAEYHANICKNKNCLVPLCYKMKENYENSRIFEESYLSFRSAYNKDLNNNSDFRVFYD